MLSRLKRGFASGIDRQGEWMAHSLHSRAAFVWLVYGTILWIPFVITGIDPHGFLYLYIATSLSLITQVPLAMLAFWAAMEARKNEEMTRQMLLNQTDMMKLMLNKFGGFEEELEEVFEDIREHHLGEDPKDIEEVFEEIREHHEHPQSDREAS